MKYFCKNCGTELVIGERIVLEDLFEDGMECPFDCTHVMEEVPDYESPQAYEKRTGKAYSINGLVYCSQVHPNGVWGIWHVMSYFMAVHLQEKDLKGIKIAIAIPPVPPPDDWRPE
jgi:hypothetical protein